MRKRILLFMLLGTISVPLKAREPAEWNTHSAKQWAATREWSEGWSVKPHRLTDWRQFADQYHRNRDLWRKVFAWLASTDPQAHPTGVHVIEADRAWATVSEYVPKEAASANIESHRRFIDLQYVVNGNEKMGLVKPLDAIECSPYDEGRDVALYISDKVIYRKTAPGCFFLFFPSDIHQPSVLVGQERKSRKIVIKIEYSE